MRRLSIWVIGFIWIGTAGFAVSGLGQYTQVTEKFLPGDAVRIQVWQLWESKSDRNPMINLNGDYSINSRGYIRLPFVGLVRVVGKTPTQVAEIIRTKYSAYLKEPFIVVRPLIRVSMRGAFNKPGSYRIDPESSLWELVEMAGGVTNNCNIKKLAVYREGRKVIDNLLESFEKGYSLKDINIQSGDQIFAPVHRPFTIRTVLSYANFAATLALLYLRLENRW